MEKGDRERTGTLTISITLLVTQPHQVHEFLAIPNTFKTGGTNYHYPIPAPTSHLLHHYLLSRPTKFLSWLVVARISVPFKVLPLQIIILQPNLY